MAEIKEAIPDALFVHIIRDGRDVALSLDKTGWITPFPWDRQRTLQVAGLQWEWVVNKGRQVGRELGSQYREVFFEDLVGKPNETLSDLGAFIHHDLDYERIKQNPVGSVRRPNTSFDGEARDGSFNPVGRWRTKLSTDELREMESLIGASLGDLGYALASGDTARIDLWRLRLMRAGYRAYYSTKQWAKVNTPLSRYLADIEMLSR